MVVAKADVEATIKKHQDEMTNLMKEGDPKFVELYDQNATLVNGKVMRGFVGREAIAEILKPHLKQDMKINPEEYFATDGGQYIVVRGHFDLGEKKNCPFEKVYKRVGDDRYVLLYDEFGLPL
ncbi:hypothetical protein AAVH_06252 [Aphelenchoides avenae]|nr:hypothetical protein AAVH_06252 [Aphelenchus avenae]